MPKPTIGMVNWGDDLNGYLDEIVPSGEGEVVSGGSSGTPSSVRSIYHPQARGAVADGTTNDTVAINATIDAAYDASDDDTATTIRLVPGATHIVARRVVGSTSLGHVRLRRGQELDGGGATLKLSESDTTTATVIINRRPDHADDAGTATTQTTITADLVIGDTQIEVTSSTGFAADDWVLIKFGDNAYDDVQTIDHLFAQIVTVDDATHITIDRPVQRALDVSAVTGSNNKSVRLLVEPQSGGYIHDLNIINTQVGTARSEGSIAMYHTRGLRVERVTATNPGPGLYFAYPEDLSLDDIYIPQSHRPGPASTSHGRGIGMWNAKNVHMGRVRIEDFEDAALFIESYSRGVTVDELHLVNNMAGRDNANEPLLMIVQGSEVDIRTLLVEGNGGFTLASSGGTTNTLQLGDVSIQTGTDPLQLSLHQIYGTLTWHDIKFEARDIRRRSVFIELANSMTNVNVPLPSGTYRRAWIYASDTTGVTSAVLRGNSTNFPTTSLVSGGRVELTGTGNFGSSYARNDLTTSGLTKFCRINTTTITAGAYLVVEVEYWPADPATGLPSPNDGAKGLPVVYTGNATAYTTTNVTTDRTYDANATTTDEIADVLGTLIADLKRRGIVG